MELMRKVENYFAWYGKFVFDNKWLLAIVWFLLNGIFGLGLLSLRLNNDIEDLFVNTNTETGQLEGKLSKLYLDKSGDKFVEYASVGMPIFVEIIVSGKNEENLLEPLFINETIHMLDYIKNITIISEYQGVISYEDLCALNSGECVISGKDILEELSGQCDGSNVCLLNISKLNSLTLDENFSVLENIGQYTKINDTVLDAKHFKFILYLRQNTQGLLEDSKLWQRQFVEHMSEFRSAYLDVVYSHSRSLLEELGEDTYPDIRYFSFAFTILLFYLGFYISGGDCVSRRVNIGRMGTIVVPLSVLGAWGLLSGSGSEFTNTVGVMPYFLIYYEINNVLLTFNSVAEYSDKLDARDRVSMALRSTGVPITITTITYAVTYSVGTASGYKAVQIFSLFTATTIAFVYINHMVFFTACLSIHEQRIDSNRHWCTCNTVQAKSKIAPSRSCCFRCCCSGKRPSSIEDTSSTIERLSRKLLSFFVFRSLVKVMVFFLVMLYAGVSVWKVLEFEVSAFTPNLVTKTSYFSKFERVNNARFQSKFYVSFIMPGYVLTGDKTTLVDAFSIEEKIKINKYIDDSSLISWFDEYTNSFHDAVLPNTTLVESIESFLSSNPEYRNDFAKDANGNILCSRIYARTRNIKGLSDVHLFKQSLLNGKEFSDNKDELDKNIFISQGKDENTDQDSTDSDEENTDSDKAEVTEDVLTTDKFLTIHAPIFKYTDKYFSALKESIIQISTLIGTNVFLITLVCPHPLVFFLATASFACVILGLCGFMSLLHIYLTPFSLILTVLGSCYAVDVVTHSIYSFYHKPGPDRLSRAHEMLSTTTVLLFNTTLISFIGMLVLFVEKSYVFLTVMKIIMIATAICCIHAAVVMPIALSMFGPKDESYPKSTNKMRTVKQIKVPNWFKDSDNQNCNVEKSAIKTKFTAEETNPNAFDNDSFYINEKF